MIKEYFFQKGGLIDFILLIIILFLIIGVVFLYRKFISNFYSALEDKHQQFTKEINNYKERIKRLENKLSQEEESAKPMQRKPRTQRAQAAE